MSAAKWQSLLTEWQRELLARYGHIAADELRELGRKGELSHPIIAYLLAARSAGFTA